MSGLNRSVKMLHADANIAVNHSRRLCNMPRRLLPEIRFSRRLGSIDHADYVNCHAEYCYRATDCHRINVRTIKIRQVLLCLPNDIQQHARGQSTGCSP